VFGQDLGAVRGLHRGTATEITPNITDNGGLISYYTNWLSLRRKAAFYVDKIIKGAKPADLPVEEPTTFQLVVNLKAAKALGLSIPPSILTRADQVIE
jgi:putative tryptophan/tyrosine transport system substrate-binding protein